MPHAAARIWALFQDYDRWTDYAPMVKRVDVLWPGDAEHNGRLVSVNRLTMNYVDKDCAQPIYKHCAVKLTKV